MKLIRSISLATLALNLSFAPATLASNAADNDDNPQTLPISALAREHLARHLLPAEKHHLYTMTIGNIEKTLGILKAEEAQEALPALTKIFSGLPEWQYQQMACEDIEQYDAPARLNYCLRAATLTDASISISSRLYFMRCLKLLTEADHTANPMLTKFLGRLMKRIEKNTPIVIGWGSREQQLDAAGKELYDQLYAAKAENRAELIIKREQATAPKKTA